MSYLLMEIFVCLLIASLVGFVLGWIMRGQSQKTSLTSTIVPTDNKIPSDTATEQKIENKTSTPPLLSQAREEGKDNLSLLKGIGPVVEKKLNKIGIYHFDQIALWSIEEQAWVDIQIGFPKKVEREEWVKQAKELTLQ